ncbi:protein spaetzle 3 isoform X2 [Hyalella azteca]|uniref:Protein spaetzle 3 isoform X2 n=1 Tax=Hyalella azteca TaxID=294128 RepID=A0A8B7NSM7_HYAAZ|nr:protein spaetzle 3 isoform X2 [Hyalella azteca]
MTMKSNKIKFLHFPACSITVLWTALSLALGVEVQGEIVRGLPCIKRLNQLFCRNAGTSYPSENIESFIDENKALTRRMYGDFQSELGLGEIVESAIRSFRMGRSVGDEPLPAPQNSTGIFASNLNDILLNLEENIEDFPGADTISTYLGPGFYSTFYDEVVNRTRRQAAPAGGNRRPSVPSVPNPPTSTSNSNRLDSCNSKMEIVTPYWASNSAGKILAIVNLSEFSQVIHQEVCTRSSTKRCNGDCGCEQKYKWHRMLAYDLENECKGIFVDWFLFPSCCVCRCDP